MVNFGSWSSPRRISTALLSWLRSTLAATECASAETVAKIRSASWVGNCQKGQPLDRKLDQNTDKEAIKTRGIVLETILAWFDFRSNVEKLRFP